MEQERCQWCLGSADYIEYHDKQWGVPTTVDKTLFEFLILEGMQAGLSWSTILKKRAAMSEAFFNYCPQTLASLDTQQVEHWLQNKSIIRNRLKLQSVINNAQAYLKVLEQHDSFAHFIWQFSEGQVITNAWARLEDVPASTVLSETMSKVLKNQGFRFVGPTICYAYMQAVGIVNDHLVSCFRHQEIIDALSQTSNGFLVDV